MDKTGFSMKGSVIVSEKPSVKQNVKVKVAGFEALYDTNSGTYSHMQHPLKISKLKISPMENFQVEQLKIP